LQETPAQGSAVSASEAESPGLAVSPPEVSGVPLSTGAAESSRSVSPDPLSVTSAEVSAVPSPFASALASPFS
jgi:hypothetical protein